MSPKGIIKIFPNDIYLKSLNKELSKHSSLQIRMVLIVPVLSDFCWHTGQYAPCEKKTIRRNHSSSFINKEISKVIIKQAQLPNIFLKIQTIESKLAYTKQQNYCVTLTRRSKKEYYGKLDVKSVMDNKKIWKTVIFR